VVSDGRLPPGPRESKLNRPDGFANERGKKEKKKREPERTEISGPGSCGEEEELVRKQRACEREDRGVFYSGGGRDEARLLLCIRRFVAIVAVDSAPPRRRVSFGIPFVFV